MIAPCRVHDGHQLDPELDKAASEILARRGTRQVEGGYCFTRDRRLKDVGDQCDFNFFLSLLLGLPPPLGYVALNAAYL